MDYRSSFKAFIQPFSKLGLWISSFLLLIFFSCFGFADSASAADRVVLIYETARTTVTYEELEEFASGTEPSEALQAFFQNTGSLPEEQRFLLNDPIVPMISLELGSDLTEFAAIEVNQIMGDPLGRESFDSLEAMLHEALIDDRSFNILELVKTYPDSIVRLNLDRLSQVQTEISVFVERLHPLLQAVDVVLNDLFCACENAPIGPARMTEGSAPQTLSFNPVASPSSLPCSVNLSPSSSLLATLPTPSLVNGFQPAVGWAISRMATATSHGLALAEPIHLAQAEREFPIRTAEEVVITFGPLARSIPMTELTTLAETGVVSSRLRSLLGIARIAPDNLRAILNKEAQVSLSFLDQQLNTPLGAFALYEVGKVVRTRSNKANIQSLRSALVLSARNDNKITLIELLQNYPGSQVYLEGAKLAKLASLASDQNTLQEFTIHQVEAVEDFLVYFQASIAAEICNCNATE